jgi:hypothetical protein
MMGLVSVAAQQATWPEPSPRADKKAGKKDEVAHEFCCKNNKARRQASS